MIYKEMEQKYGTICSDKMRSRGISRTNERGLEGHPTDWLVAATLSLNFQLRCDFGPDHPIDSQLDSLLDAKLREALG